jgi:DNA-binding NtrC family response regulator
LNLHCEEGAAIMGKPRLLFVDDEERVVRSLAMQFRSSHLTKGCIDPAEALELVRKDHYHVVVSDQRMPKMQGIELLRQVREISPLTLCILLTGYADLSAVIGAINEGEIFRYLSKPWDPKELREVLDKATGIALEMEQHGEGEVSPAEVDHSMDANLMVIDDNREVYESICNEFPRESYTVYWAPTLDQAIELLSNHDIAVVITELQLGEDDITPALKTLKQYNPNVLTIVLTSMQDADLLINLINQAQVFRYLPKPIRPGLVAKNVATALRHRKQLRAVPVLAKRHNVEKSAEEPSMPGNVSGFLKQFRERFALENSQHKR